MKKIFYKQVTIIIQTTGNNHIIGLSITDATRHKFCSYDEAISYAKKWADNIIRRKECLL